MPLICGIANVTLACFNGILDKNAHTVVRYACNDILPKKESKLKVWQNLSYKLCTAESFTLYLTYLR